MSYLLDKKKKQKRLKNILIFSVIIFFLIYFNRGIFSGLSSVTHTIFKPFVSFGNSVERKISNLGNHFSSKRNLAKENEDLKEKINLLEADLANHKTIEEENSKLKEILNRKSENKELILSGILSKPNQSLYDILIIDAGENDGIRTEARVFAYGNIPIGKVSEVFSNTSKIVLFSTPGEKTEVVIGGRDTFMTLVGRGGGNFEMTLPRDFIIEIGSTVHLPGIDSYIVGTVETIISDPRDAFQKALLTSPINIQELKFVEVEK